MYIILYLYVLLIKNCIVFDKSRGGEQSRLSRVVLKKKKKKTLSHVRGKLWEQGGHGYNILKMREMPWFGEQLGSYHTRGGIPLAMGSGSVTEAAFPSLLFILYQPKAEKSGLPISFLFYFIFQGKLFFYSC